MSKFRKRPVVIEARRVLPTKALDVALWCGGVLTSLSEPGDALFKIPTLEGWMDVRVGDYVICGVQGEFYPCKPDIFESTYEAVSE